MGICDKELPTKHFTPLLGSDVQFGSGKLFEDTPIEFERSYLCNKTRIFTGYGIDTRNTTNVTLSVDDFHVQAFNFTNSSTGAFDNGELLFDL